MDAVEAELDNLLAEFDADHVPATTKAPAGRGGAKTAGYTGGGTAASLGRGNPAVSGGPQARSATPTRTMTPNRIPPASTAPTTAPSAQPGRTATPNRTMTPNRLPPQQTPTGPGISASDELESLLNDPIPPPSAVGGNRGATDDLESLLNELDQTTNPSRTQVQPHTRPVQSTSQVMPQNARPQVAQPIQPQNYQPQRMQTMQPQNYPGTQARPQSMNPMGMQQPQVLQPQNYQPQAQTLQPQNYSGRPQSINPIQQPQVLQPQNYQQPQVLQPQNYQPQNYAARPQSIQFSQSQNRLNYMAGTEAEYETLNDDLALLGINDLADSIEQKMETMGFVPLSNNTISWDEDNNTASDFKVSGVTNTQVGEVHDIVLRPLCNDQPCEIRSPQKYISVIFEHEAGVPVKSWIRDNENCTYSLGFCCNTQGRMSMSISLMGQQLFNLPIFISPGGDEKQWIVRAQQPVLARMWSLNITRVDGEMPEGRHPFEVQTSGPIENMSIAPCPGGYQVTALPVGAGPVTVTIQLFGANILGSPLNTTVIDPLSVNPPVQVASFGVNTSGAQARSPQNAINLQPINRPQNATPQQLQPQNTRTLQPQNMVSPQQQQSYSPQSPINLQPQNVMVMQPQNVVNLQPQNVRNLQPQNAMAMQPQNAMAMQPQNARSMQPQNVMTMQPQNVRQLQPQNVRPAAGVVPQNARTPSPAPAARRPAPPPAQATQNADDALANLLNELDQY